MVEDDPTDTAGHEFEVFVDDNFHYMDEDERYNAGSFGTYEEALAHAKRLVDRSLTGLLEPGMDQDELMSRYVMFGDDPWIRPTPDGAERFSAREYARSRAGVVTSAR
jgi:hypothetical protein